ncbi:MAG: cytochrome b [Pseudomonadota bacterium]
MSLPVKNTDARFGKIAMALHWSVALLFLLLYVSVYYRRWFTEPSTDINMSALHLHLSFGITVAVFVFLRVLYKFWDKTPKDVPGSKLEHFAAHSAHILLYVVMIVMPLSGYFGTGLPTDFFFAFEIPRFRDTGVYDLVVTQWMGLTWEQFEGPVDFVHKRGGATVVWMLIAVHIAAALFHHFVRKDETLVRMLPVKLKEEK